MRKRNEHVRIHDRSANLCASNEFAIDRDFHVIRSLDSVSDDRMAFGRKRVIAVAIRGVQMVERILAGTDVKRRAIGHERLTAERANEPNDRARVIRTQKRKIALFAEMQLDRRKFILEIDRFDARRANETHELCAKILVAGHAHRRKIHLASIHNDTSFDFQPHRHDTTNSPRAQHFATRFRRDSNGRL